MTQNLIRSHIIYYGKNWKGKKYPFANLKSFWHLIWKNFCNLNCLWQYLKLRDKHCWRRSKCTVSDSIMDTLSHCNFMKLFISMKFIVFDYILYEGLIAQLVEHYTWDWMIAGSNFAFTLHFFFEKAIFLKSRSNNFH
jgi:hypothetical protein